MGRKEHPVNYTKRYKKYNNILEITHYLLWSYYRIVNVLPLSLLYIIAGMFLLYEVFHLGRPCFASPILVYVLAITLYFQSR